MENVSRAQTGDRQIFALVLLLEHLSVQISVELLSWGGGLGFPRPSHRCLLPFESSHKQPRNFQFEKRFLREFDLVLHSLNLLKGKHEPLLFTWAHLAAADRLSAEIRGLFSRVKTWGGWVFARLSDMILRNGAGKSSVVGVRVISYGGCTCLLTAALCCISLSPEAHLFLLSFPL